MGMYHEGNRALQAEFGTTALADRLEQAVSRRELTDGDRTFIEAQSFFFLATADGEGRPDCSFKGGMPGFVRVLAPDLLVFPDYDGNGMFKSLGNIRANPHVGLLFIAMGAQPMRLRVNGTARLSFDDPMMKDFAGAQGLVRVTPKDVFPNCPRYIPDENGEPSKYAPRADVSPEEPVWKSFDLFKDVVPPRRV